MSENKEALTLEDRRSPSPTLIEREATVGGTQTARDTGQDGASNAALIPNRCAPVNVGPYFHSSPCQTSVPIDTGICDAVLLLRATGAARLPG